MKTKKSPTNYFVAVCFLFLLMSGNISAMELTFATDDTPGPPYIIGEGTTFNRQKPGIELEVYQLMAKRLDLDIQYIRLPWARCLTALEQGKIEGVFPASFKEKRLKVGVYPMRDGRPDPKRKTRDNAYSLYKLKDSKLDWDGTRFVNLEGSIGAPIGWAIVNTLQDMGVKVAEIPHPRQSLEMLRNKRLPGVAGTDIVIDTYIKQSQDKYGDIVKDHPPLEQKPYYLMLSHQFVREHPDVAEKIWNTIAEIIQSEDFTAIAMKYSD